MSSVANGREWVPSSAKQYTLYEDWGKETLSVGEDLSLGVLWLGVTSSVMLGCWLRGSSRKIREEYNSFIFWQNYNEKSTWIRLTVGKHSKIRLCTKSADFTSSLMMSCYRNIKNCGWAAYGC